MYVNMHEPDEKSVSFHIMARPYGVPKFATFLVYIRRPMDKDKGKTRHLLIPCSAGVDHTETFIIYSIKAYELIGANSINIHHF